MKCAHHWVIDAASGPVSRGTCKMCGEMREFQNSFVHNTWATRTVPEKQGSEKAAQRR